MCSRHGWPRRWVALLGVVLLTGCYSPSDDGHRIYGYVDSHGRLAIEPAFLDARAFSEGLAAVQVAGGWGYLDRDGRWVIPPRYSAAAPFAEGRAAVSDERRLWGFVDTTGRVVVPPRFKRASRFIDGRAYGLLPERYARKCQPLPGDRVLALGGRTGRDGIHGATFSSTAMTSDTIQVNAQAVQIGNPIEEKRLLDAILVCRDQGLIRAITDCGAGGFSSAIGEMGKPLGVTVDLERAPLKYSGLAPWEIFVSESQERMVLAVAPENVPALLEVCRRYNVEATDLGVFEATGRLVVRHDGEVVGDLDMAFLHDGWPERRLQATFAPRPGPAELPEPPRDRDGWRQAVLEVLGTGNVASKEPIVRQYDHTVQGSCAGAPFGGRRGHGPGDAAVLAPLLGRPYGMIIAHGMNPVLNTFDPYWGTLWAGAEAMSNLVAVGGDPDEDLWVDDHAQLDFLFRVQVSKNFSIFLGNVKLSSRHLRSPSLLADDRDVLLLGLARFAPPRAVHGCLQAVSTVHQSH